MRARPRRRPRGTIAGGHDAGPGAIVHRQPQRPLESRPGQQEYEVELATPLWLPGQKAAREDAAASQIDEVPAKRVALALGAGRRAARGVVERWPRRATPGRWQARRVDDGACALESDVRRRFRAGDLSRIDGNLAQSEVLAAEAELIEAEAACCRRNSPARADWRQRAGRRAGEESPTPIAAREPVQRHRRTRCWPPPPLPRAARGRATTVAAESRRCAPELALRVVRERGDFAEPYANSIGVRLTIPFSSGALVRRDKLGRQAEASQADAEMLRCAEPLSNSMTERARRAISLPPERQLAMAEDRRALAADNLRLAEKAFALGESDLTTLLRIRAAAFEAEAFLDRQRVARAAAISRLNQALGALP
jgi:cobalt-zinc-cadmium efflux system outer membrane protein